MKYEDKKLLWIIGGTLVAIGGIAYYFYMQGKKQTTIATLPPDDNPIPGPGQPSTGATQTALVSIAADLYNDMKGINLAGHDPLPYQDAVNLSDIDFVRLYNIFNAKYQPASGQTLTEWFNSEQYIILGDPEQSVYFAFQEKLNKLNLK